jgi:hypothetical protein
VCRARVEHEHRGAYLAKNVGDQQHASRNGDGTDGKRGALSCRRNAFYRDGCRNERHRAQIHDSDYQQDCRQIRTGVTTVDAEMQAMSPGGLRICR